MMGLSKHIWDFFRLSEMMIDDDDSTLNASITTLSGIFKPLMIIWGPFKQFKQQLMITEAHY